MIFPSRYTEHMPVTPICVMPFGVASAPEEVARFDTWRFAKQYESAFAVKMSAYSFA
jgi:hypothetical protein